MPKPNVAPVFALASAALAALAAAGCGSRAAAKPASSSPPLAVQTAPLALLRPRLSFTLPAELAAYQDVQLQARVAGFIRRLYADRGSRVSRGQLLAVIEAPDLVAQRAAAEHRVASARSQRVEAEAALERDRVTLARLRGAQAEMAGAVAGNDIHVAEETVAADQAEVASRRAAEAAAEQALRSQIALEDYLRVTAPFAGMIVRRAASEGALTGPGAGSLFELQQLDPLRLVVDVPEAEAIGIEIGARVPFTVADAPGRVYYGRVARIAHSLRRETRTMPVELDVANPDLKLAPGMYAHVSWTFQRDQSTWFAPAAAVVRGTERTFLELDQNGVVAWQDVTTGFSDGDRIEVFGPIAAGERVITPGDDALRPGAKVSAAP